MAYLVFMWTLLPLYAMAQSSTGPNEESTAGEPSGEESITVVEASGQAGALEDRQKERYIQSSLSYHQMDLFADYTVEDALYRVAGMQVSRKGVINLRGVGPDRYLVMFNGQRMATSGMGVRSYDLRGISSEMVQDIEVIKVRTPDMDPEGMGGAINLISYRPGEGERKMDIRIGGGGNTRYMPYMSPQNRAYLRYQEGFGYGVTLEANLSYQQDYRSRESLELEYGLHDFENTQQVDVIEGISPIFENEASHRFGGGLYLTYEPGEQNRYHVWGALNRVNRDRSHHQNRWMANEGWSEYSPNELKGSGGSYGYDFGLQDVEIQQYDVQAGGEHFTDYLNLAYRIGWTQNLIRHQDYLFSFLVDRLDYTIDMEDRTRPIMQVEDFNLMPDGTIHNQHLDLQDFGRLKNAHRSNIVIAGLDIEIPFGSGSFKVGSSGWRKSKEGNFSDMLFTYRRLTLNHFKLRGRGGYDLMAGDSYRVPYLMQGPPTQNFFDAQFQRFRTNLSRNALESDIWNYVATENNVAGYGMGTFEFGRFTLLAGARMEFDDNQYEGYRVERDFIGFYNDTFDTTATAQQTYLMPHGQVLYSHSPNTSIGFAYSKTIDRPVFQQLAPFDLTNVQDTTRFRGNPDLEAMVSDNLDMFAEHRFGRGGLVSFGLFHKSLSNFIFLRERTIEIGPGEVAGFAVLFDEVPSVIPVKETLYMNTDEKATLYGVEISLQHRLDFLPGFLSNFGTYATYTWSESNYELSYRDNDLSLPGHSPHVVNLALDYSQGRFSGQLAYHWTDEMLAIDGLQSEPEPDSEAGHPVYMDRYEDGWKDVSATARLRISDSFYFWADARNLLGGLERIRYADSRTQYPLATDWRGGRTLTLGIHFTL